MILCSFLHLNCLVLFFIAYIYIYIFFLALAAVDHHCFARAFSNCSAWGLLFVAVCRLLIVVSLLVAEHRL